MANDAIWIRCKLCGKGFLVTKYYPSCDISQLDTSESSLQNWLSEHLAERQDKDWKIGGNDLEKESGFEFTTDDPETATGQLYTEDGPLWSLNN